MRGFVTEIMEKKTKKNGKPFQIYVIGSEEFSQWDEKHFDRVEEGDLLYFDVKESGDFKNITVNKIYKVLAEEEFRKMQELINEKKHYIRMSALKTSSNLLNDLKISPYEKGSLALDMSDQFEKYIRGEQVDEEFFNTKESKSGPDEG